jgi:methylase of polypeptide subunit release factors
MEFYSFLEDLYLKHSSKNYRKKHGEFYTPNSIVRKILDSVHYKYTNPIESKLVADISCGAGSFLTECTKELRNRLITKHNHKSIEKLPTIELKKIIQTIKNNIYGIDINPIACFVCHLNLYFLTFDIIEEIIRNKKDYEIPFFNIINQNSFKLFLNEDFSSLKEKKFDLIVGNPPYLFIRDVPPGQKELINSTNLKTVRGQYDYYQLFIEMGLKLLTENGYLGYIVPDSLLALSNRRIIRKYIFKNAKINEIHIVGDQFDEINVSNIIIIAQKKGEIKEIDINKIKVIMSYLDKNNVNYFNQKNIKDWNYNYLVHLNERDNEILVYLKKNFIKLGDLRKDEKYKILLNRGIELGKSGEVIFCENCNKFQPVPRKEKQCSFCGNTLPNKAVQKVIFDHIPQSNQEKYKKFIYSMERYRINNFKYIDSSLEGINYKDLDSYKNRIIIRQIAQKNLICATYYPEEALSSQSTYNLKIESSEIPEFNHFYLLGLLNSKLLSYYFSKSFGSYKQFFPRILIEKIKKLPIKLPKSSKEKQISIKLSKEVKRLLELYKHTNNNLDENEQKISEYVFELYKIPKDERLYINNSLMHYSNKN